MPSTLEIIISTSEEFQINKMNLLAILLGFVLISWANGATVEVETDYENSPNLKDWSVKMEDAIKGNWETVTDFLAYDGYTAPPKLWVKLDSTCNDGISTGNERYTVCAKDLNSKAGGPNQGDLGRIVQATTFSVFHYPAGVPDWLTKCMSAYLRWYKYEESDRPPKPRKSDTSPKKTSHDSCGYWLNWVQENYAKDPTVVQQIFKITKQGKYKDQAWKDITGKSGKELWDQMQFSTK